MGNYRESGEVLFMKNGMKKTAAVVMAAMLMGTGAFVSAVEDMGIFSQTAIVAEAASVGKVTGLKSKTLSNSEIQLNWSKVKGASGYTVYMRKNGKYNKLGDCKGTSYTVKKLPNATRENFKVRAYKTVKGKKVYGKYSSNWNTATNPQACKGLKVSKVTDKEITLSWSKIGCTNYRVYMLDNGKWELVSVTNYTSCTLYNFDGNSTYKFKVRACKKDDRNVSHYGKYSSVVSAKTHKQVKITQADIDAMQKELQEYSRSKANYIREHYTEFWKFGIDYNTVDEYFALLDNELTPENAGYDDVYAIHFTDTKEDLQEFIELYKRHLDYEYKKRNDVYYVVHVDCCPNGIDVKPFPCWTVYPLY